MISILARERLLGFALGSALGGFVVLEQRRGIYESISDEKPQIYDPSKVKEAILGKQKRSEFAHLWNKAVDQTFGPLIESLSSRRA